MEGKIKKFEEPPEMVPEPSPTITPEMVRTVFRMLETKGMVQYFEGGVYIPTEKGWKLLMSTKTYKEEVIAFGNPKITATDNLSIKITKSEEVDESTIGVKADKACLDFSEEFRNALKSNKIINITLEVEGISDSITAYCSPVLEASSINEITVRKDDSVDSSTIGIMSDKSASDLKRELIEKLKNPKTKIRVILEIRS
jgi:hypothetical protein